MHAFTKKDYFIQLCKIKLKSQNQKFYHITATNRRIDVHFFTYTDDLLHAEDVPVPEIVREHGTPLYIYSHKTLIRHFRAYNDAFHDFPHIICYALKANSTGALLRLFASEGGGADIVSGGELYRALKAGIPADKIVYAGVGKTHAEISASLRESILMFNVESQEELTALDTVAGDLNVKAPIALRINPDIDPETHPYISTGLQKHKFGIPIGEALEYYRLAHSLKNIDVVGIHKHIGSQITNVSPFVDALKRLLPLVDALQDDGIPIRYLDLGGGLGIQYEDEDPPHPSELAEGIISLLTGRDITIILEPGRSLVGNAGILVSRVLYTKKGKNKDFIILDAGMNDLMRPTLYDAYHHIIPVFRNMREIIQADIVGPICETGDFFGKERAIPSMRQGELLAVMGSGAYGFSMSSNYNSRPRAAEVLVKGNEYFLIKRRETYEDLTRGESIPDFLTP